jgi:type VI secretion system secreted protein Hcp
MRQLMAIFMKIKGVEGSVTAAGFEQCIKINSLHHQFTQPINRDVSTTRNRVLEQLCFFDINITKTMDNASCSLRTNAYTARVMPSVEFFIVKTGEQLSVLARMLFYKVLITKYETSVSSGGLPLEALSLSFTKTESAFYAYDTESRTTKPIISGFNLESMEIT